MSTTKKILITLAAIAVYILIEWLVVKNTGFLSSLSTNTRALGTFKGQLGTIIALAATLCLARPLMGYKIVPDWFGSRDWKWYGIACLGAVVIMLSSHLVHVIYHTDNSWMDKVLRGDSAGLYLMLLTAFVLAPINEEIIFRGVLFHLFSKIKLGTNAAFHASIPIVFTALLFMTVHLQYALPDRLVILLLGIWLGWIRYKTNSLSIPMAAHAVAGIVGVVGFFCFP